MEKIIFDARFLMLDNDPPKESPIVVRHYALDGVYELTNPEIIRKPRYQGDGLKYFVRRGQSIRLPPSCSSTRFTREKIINLLMHNQFVLDKILDSGGLMFHDGGYVNWLQVAISEEGYHFTLIDETTKNSNSFTMDEKGSFMKEYIKHLKQINSCS